MTREFAPQHMQKIPVAITAQLALDRVEWLPTGCQVQSKPGQRLDIRSLRQYLLLPGKPVRFLKQGVGRKFAAGNQAHQRANHVFRKWLPTIWPVVSFKLARRDRLQFCWQRLDCTLHSRILICLHVAQSSSPNYRCGSLRVTLGIRP